MALKLTPQDIKEMVERWGSTLVSPEDFRNLLNELPPQERMAYFATFPKEELLMSFKPEELLMSFKPEERLMGLKPEERLRGLKPEERLAGLSPKEIEDYLKTIENQGK